MTRLPSLALIGLLALAGCKSGPGYHAGDTWQLAEIGGVPFQGAATLTFPEDGRLAGEAPCNAYFADQTGEYPVFAPGPIGATRRACPGLPLELAYLAALERMTEARINEAGDQLTLSGPQGISMVFRAAE
jgi:heat shock protein HslJ